ncbi:MAG: hypothetical protein DSO04_03790 [Hadesarchaea archaeon]|nr:MAG: hypothetical protein DSO04_03790 [Hadesarchaea archaeon]
MEISIRLEYLSAERLWEHGKPFPKDMHLSTSLSLTEVKPEQGRVVISFSVSIHYAPSVAQMNLRGKAVLTGGEEELGRAVEAYGKQRAPPVELLQPLMGAVLVEATLLSRSLQLPPPLPLPVLSRPPEGREDKPFYVG